jgi:hypothetical protein
MPSMWTGADGHVYAAHDVVALQIVAVGVGIFTYPLI